MKNSPKPFQGFIEDTLKMNWQRKSIRNLLGKLAQFILWRYRPKIVGITGSIGKTSTTQFTETILSKKFTTRTVDEDFTTDIAVSASILGIKAFRKLKKGLKDIPKLLYNLIIPQKYPQILILELRSQKKGRIRYLSELVRPEVGIITAIAPSHMEHFKDLKTVFIEKKALVECIPKHGLVILNFDDQKVRDMASSTQAKVFYFGLDKRADIWADKIEVSLEGLRFGLHFKNKRHVVYAPGIINKYHIYPILAAVACAYSLGMKMNEIISALKDSEPVEGRGNKVLGPKSSILINDTFNANPKSTCASLEILEDVAGDRRKIAVLGNMLELGQFEEKSHKEVGRKAARIVDLLVTSGNLAKIIAQEAIECGLPKEKIFITKSSKEAASLLKSKIQKGDIILVKGSHGARMREVINTLKSDKIE